MTPAEILALINGIRLLSDLIAREVALLRKKGELTPELEAAYQEHQRLVYESPDAQPEPPV